MKKVIRSIAAVSVLAVSAATVLAAPAHADTTKGLHGSYLGGGVAVGTIGDGARGEVAGNVTGRFDIPDVPVSLRASAVFNDKNATFLPKVTGDIPIANNTNLYLGGGGSFVLNNNMTPLGNRNAWVATAGIETAINDNLVVYAESDLALNSFKNNNNDDGLAVLLGAAYKF